MFGRKNNNGRNIRKIVILKKGLIKHQEVLLASYTVSDR